MEFSDDEIMSVGEAIDDRLSLLRKLPPGQWRDLRLQALESVNKKLAEGHAQGSGLPAQEAENSEMTVMSREGLFPCPACGYKMRPGSNFCLKCGTRMPSAYFSAQPTRVENAPRQPEGQASIEKPASLLLQMDNQMQEYRLDKPEMTIGRASNMDVMLSRDKLTSRHHATLRYENGGYVLYDNFSANGTFLNGQRLAAMTPYMLQNGDHVNIGDHELVFRS